MKDTTSTLSSVMRVNQREGFHTSYSSSLVSLGPGALFARTTCPPMTLTSKARWSSVQVSENQHIELNTDLVFINHSCEPSLEFHVLSDASDQPVLELRVATRVDENGHPRGLSVGDELTFFYPSTEWEMQQTFKCLCGTKSCHGEIRGAKYMTPEQLRGYFINAHIEDLRSVPASDGKKGP
ncbi:hypothetical protein PV08_04203 [Exophiala spinifera]|uniref:Post-SET domain-containing protein n=1 Tax=Exophiala spinifera TaxID=91928 RepID=A0A0D1ZWH9_9EURO|nr:uncharacterized protein PV08_04203 [Exophiala spinifera]KIW17012.1 hypothetical protein PV08_04203 [Exophiala spinifera]